MGNPKVTNLSPDVFFIKAKVGKLPLASGVLKKITINEKLHNIIPYGTLVARVTPDILSHFLIVGTKVEIEWKMQDFTEKLEFMIIGFDFKQVENSEYLVTLNIILNVPDYFQASFKQESHKDKTTKKLFGSISSVTPKVQIKGDTNDKQTWIRPNYTDKNFVDYLYDYSYLKNDLILLCLNRKKELIVDNFKNITSKKPKKISNFKKDDIRYSSYSFSKHPSILDYKLSPLRKVRIFRLPIHKVDVQEISANSLFTGKKYDDLKPYIDFKVRIDNMNTYGDYIYANQYNRVKRQRLEFFKLNLELETAKFFEIELLDYVEFKEKQFRSQRLQQVLAGNYIVGEKSFTLTENGIENHRVTLYRDYFMEG